jgi:hypothetical protein
MYRKDVPEHIYFIYYARKEVDVCFFNETFIQNGDENDT